MYGFAIKNKRILFTLELALESAPWPHSKMAKPGTAQLPEPIRAAVAPD